MKKLIVLMLGLFLLGNLSFAINFTSKVDLDWGNGFCYKFNVKNTTKAEIKGWDIKFNLQNANITSSRNGKITCSDGSCIIRGLDWNDPIKIGQKFEIGFCASGKGKPTKVVFEGGKNKSNNENTNRTNTKEKKHNNVIVKNFSIKKDGVLVSITTQSDRKDGYCRNIIIKNTTLNKVVDNWKLKFKLDQKIDGWSANYIKKNKDYIVVPLDWNKTLNPGQETKIGFCSKGKLRDDNWEINNVSLENVSKNNKQENNKQENNKQENNKQENNKQENNKQENNKQENNTDVILPAVVSTGKYKPPFYVKNGKLYDQNGKEVHLFGVNWFGFETPNHTVHGLWSRNRKNMIKQMKELGFNAVRIPVCPGTLRGLKPTGIDYYKNPDLKGLNSLQVLDKIVKGFAENGFYILLDHHRPDCNAISETPEVNGYTLKDWINDLVFLVKRYKNIPNVIGIDLKNEPHGKERWGNGDIKTDWRLQVNMAAKEILKANPNILIFVEGIQSNHGMFQNPNCESSQNHWRGGNIEPIECYPLNVPSKNLVLSPHVYGPSVYMQPYFKDPNFPNNMPKIWEQQIGRFIGKYFIAPGEWGGKYINLDKVWQKAIVNWFIKKGVCSFFFWSWNPNSGDTGGILKDDWKTINVDKYNNLKRLMYACNAGNVGTDLSSDDETISHKDITNNIKNKNDNKQNNNVENNQSSQNNNLNNEAKSTINHTTTDSLLNIKAEGTVVASYPESRWPTYKTKKFILEINPWNISKAEGYAKMYYNGKNTVTYLQNLSDINQINAGGYVLGYPEIYVGNKPWNGNYIDAGSKLPAKISDLDSLYVDANYEIEHPSNLSCNFAMEGWFTKNKMETKGVGNGEVEMMVMLYRNIQGAAGGKVGEATIPVELNGKVINEKFDIYKANIGWDFMTFIPHDVQLFKKAHVKFDILNFAKVAEQYLPQIKNLYLEDWEFGSEYGTPSTKNAKIAWKVKEYKVIGKKK